MSFNASGNSSNNSNSTSIRMLLQQCQSRIDEGNGVEALSFVLDAIRLSHGEGAIIGMLDQAKRSVDYENKFSTASLDIATVLCQRLVEQDSILSDRGEEDILIDAFQDGSSVICQRCGALVPRVRMDAHSMYWCSENDDDDDV